MTRVTMIHTGGAGDFPDAAGAGEVAAQWPQARVTIVGHPERAGLAVAGGLASDCAVFETSGCHRLFTDGARELPPVRGAELILTFLPDERLTGQSSASDEWPGRHDAELPAPGECDTAAWAFVWRQVATALEWNARPEARHN